MSLLIAAALVPSQSLESIPTEFVYLPEGDSSITATVDGKPKTVTVRVPAEKGASIAAKLQSDLVKRQGENVRPWISFQHQAGAAAALPQSFRYVPGKGVMASVEWTGAGRRAIEGKDFSYFSPTFVLGDDGVPSGLPVKGEFGALVNEPAFRNIQRIAAADAGVTQETLDQLRAMREASQPSAWEQLFDLSKSIRDANPTLSENEAMLRACEQRPELYQEWQDDAAEARSRRTPKSAAKSTGTLDSRISAMVAAGEAANSDEAAAIIFATDAEAYPAYLATLQPGKQVSAAEKVVAGATGFEAKAQALVTAGQAKTLDEAFGIVAATDPSAYSEYLATLHN